MSPQAGIPDGLIPALLALRAGAAVLERWQNATRFEGEAFEVFYLSILRHSRIDPAQALEAVERVGREEGKSLSAAQRAKVRRLLGHCLRAMGNAQKARRHYAAAWKAFEKLGQREEMGRTAIGWVDALAHCGAPDEALELVRKARKLLSRTNKIALARLELNAGNAFFVMGRWDAAARSYKEAHRRLHAAGMRQDAASCAYNLASVEMLRGRIEPARRGFEEARKVLHKRGFRALSLQAEYGLAALQLMSGEGEGGSARMQEILEELEKIGDSRSVAAIRRDLAQLYASLGAFAAAEQEAAAALSLYQKAGLRHDAAHTEFLHGRMLCELGRKVSARVRLQRARIFWEEIGNTWAQRRADVELARVLLRIGRAKDALDTLRRAQGYLDKRDATGYGALCRMLTAEAQFELGKRGLAANLAKRAHDQAKSYPVRHERPAMALLVARAAQARGDRATTLRWTRKAVEQLETLHLNLGTRSWRSRLATPRDQLLREAVDLVLDAGGLKAPAMALDLLSRSRSPGLIEALLHGRGAKMDDSLRSAVLRIRDDLLSPKDPGPDDVRHRALQEQLRELESQLEKASAPSTVPARRIARDRALAQWSPRHRGRQLVFYQATGTTWRAFVHDARGRVRCVDLPHAAAALDEHWLPLRLIFEAASQAPRARRRRLLERTEEEASSALASLRTALWSPLGLDDGEVMVIPHGELAGLPFEALAMAGEDGDSPKQWVSRSPHPAAISRRSRRPSRSALVLTGSTKGSRRETDAVRAQLSEAGYRVRQSDQRSTLLRRRAPVDVLHVAGHGSYHPDSWFATGVELSDGWLGPEQLRRETLAGSLVYMSSCESGLGESSDEMATDSWQAAGVGSGVGDMLLSLWKLDDESAMSFADAFYRSWNRGDEAPRAVAHAMLRVRAAQPHPFAWAPFSVVRGAG